MEKYHVLDLIGEGSFGRVYRGRRVGCTDIVALKFISLQNKDQKDIDNIRKELQIHKTLNHTNVIKYFDCFETDTDICVVTEYAHGDLYEILEDDKCLPEAEVRSIAIQLVSALKYLHDNRVIHRDMKPQNILICSGGIVKLCDFGFARALSKSTIVARSIKGTPLYMAPELVQEKAYDHSIDLWSLGIILYELFHSKPPFYTNNLMSLVQQIVRDRIRFTKDMSPEFKSFLKGLLQKEPGNRLQWPQLLQHPFVKVQNATSSVGQKSRPKSEVVTSQKKFSSPTYSELNIPKSAPNISSFNNDSNPKRPSVSPSLTNVKKKHGPNLPEKVFSVANNIDGVLSIFSNKNLMTQINNTLGFVSCKIKTEPALFKSVFDIIRLLHQAVMTCARVKNTDESRDMTVVIDWFWTENNYNHLVSTARWLMLHSSDASIDCLSLTFDTVKHALELLPNEKLGVSEEVTSSNFQPVSSSLVNFGSLVSVSASYLTSPGHPSSRYYALALLVACLGRESRDLNWLKRVIDSDLIVPALIGCLTSSADPSTLLALDGIETILTPITSSSRDLRTSSGQILSEKSVYSELAGCLARFVAEFHSLPALCELATAGLILTDDVADDASDYLVSIKALKILLFLNYSPDTADFVSGNVLNVGLQVFSKDLSKMVCSNGLPLVTFDTSSVTESPVFLDFCLRFCLLLRLSKIYPDSVSERLDYYTINSAILSFSKNNCNLFILCCLLLLANLNIFSQLEKNAHSSVENLIESCLNGSYFPFDLSSLVQSNTNQSNLISCLSLESIIKLTLPNQFPNLFAIPVLFFSNVCTTVPELITERHFELAVIQSQHILSLSAEFANQSISKSLSNHQLYFPLKSRIDELIMTLCVYVNTIANYLDLNINITVKLLSILFNYSINCINVLSNFNLICSLISPLFSCFCKLLNRIVFQPAIMEISFFQEKLLEINLVLIICNYFRYLPFSNSLRTEPLKLFSRLLMMSQSHVTMLIKSLDKSNIQVKNNQSSESIDDDSCLTFVELDSFMGTLSDRSLMETETSRQQVSAFARESRCSVLPFVSAIAPPTSENLVIDGLISITQLARISEESFVFIDFSGILKILPTLLRTGSDLVKAKVCSLVGNLCRHSNFFYVKLSQVGIIPLLVSCLTSEDQNVLRSATLAIGNAAYHDSSLHEIFVESSVFPFLVKCLGLKDSKIKSNAAGAIGNLARFSQGNSSNETINTALECRVLENLEILYLDEDIASGVRKVALFALGNYLGNEFCFGKANELGIIDKLKNLEKKSDEGIRKQLFKLKQKFNY
ncbi:hypothetical protein P9112_013345 [Eukaryota sp. TZLM1-RC]